MFDHVVWWSKYYQWHISIRGRRGSRSYGSWIYNYLCNQCLSLYVGIRLMARCIRYNIMWSSLSVGFLHQ